MSEISDILNLRYALDTLFLLLSGALVMWMAAGFSMLEAGLVRSKNTTEILTKNIVLYAIACIMFMLVGYSMMYPTNPVNSWWPGFGAMIGAEHDVANILGQSAESWYDGSYYAHAADFFFQVVFVATAMSIVSGAVAERMKLWPFFVFAIVLTGFIYPLQGYWKWGGGFLHAAGFQDFAGSGVVHLAGASAALAGVLLLGPRSGKYTRKGIQPITGANMPLAALGTFILWLGWLGFNGGSQLAVSTVENANAVAAVFVNTNAAAAGGVIAALLAARLFLGKADLTMVLNGAIAGLVAITAGPDTPSALLACMIGAVGGALVVASVVSLDRIKIDDPVGAISAHGVVGIWGLLAVPLSNTTASLSIQLLGIVCIGGFVFLSSLLVWAVIKAAVGIRVSEDEEYDGLDIHECGVEAYPEFTKSS
ncbi:MAG: ammonium transporter [Xanthomonadales bacterium]|nr:ammonium transporter [Xanthomonadales bacterium]